jgi:hypothetical protein
VNPLLLKVIHQDFKVGLFGLCLHPAPQVCKKGIRIGLVNPLEQRRPRWWGRSVGDCWFTDSMESQSGCEGDYRENPHSPFSCSTSDYKDLSIIPFGKIYDRLVAIPQPHVGIVPRFERRVKPVFSHAYGTSLPANRRWGWHSENGARGVTRPTTELLPLSRRGTPL